MLYFAYGSNMSSARLRVRAPSARFQAVAQLSGHELRFHKKSDRDGSAKCDIHLTHDPAHNVHGVLFAMEPADLPVLDRAEGLGAGYDKKIVTVRAGESRSLEAFTYFATDIDPALKPLDWYKEHVLRGAREHALCQQYILTIETVEAVVDRDQARRLRELGVYNTSE